MQYPIMLAFAMTVHRAQGQTLQYVDVDCYSFFAAGQMGVAVGRVETKAGLRVRNFNRSAATLKHPSCVYDFYNFINMKEPLADLSCCKKNTTRKQSSIVLPSTSDLSDYIPEDSANENDAEPDNPSKSI